MDPAVNAWMELVFRWIHVFTGVLWIGHLYFFNFVNANFAKTIDATTKKAVVPELMPRALFMFRWGAAWTWITGLLLLGLIYYHGANLFDDPANRNLGLAVGILVGSLVLSYIYDVIMKAVKNNTAAVAICVLLLAGYYWVMSEIGHFSGRALYIHVGTIFGTTMAMNVWMRIWPAQKRIIRATKDGNAPDPADVALAGTRSRHNTFMSVPLLFTMISNHYPLMYGHELAGVWLAVLVAVSWLFVHWMYNKSAKVQGF